MIIRVDGNHDGIFEYLVNGTKKGRELTRDELDARLPLVGDIKAVDNVIKSLNLSGDQYYTFVLSFKEDHVDVGVLQDIVLKFREYYFKAYSDDELCYAAEIHYPKVKSRQDAHGQILERKPHIHMTVVQINMLDGERIVYNEKKTEWARDAFQEYINCTYGLASPKDNRRYKLNSNSEYLSRYKGDGFKGSGKIYRQNLLNNIVDGDIYNTSDLRRFLEESGQIVTVRNVNSPEKSYLNVKVANESINLRDYVFKNEFLALDKAQKIEYLNKHSNVQVNNQYLEQNKPREVPSKYLKAIDDWVDLRGFYWRYGSKFTNSERAKWKKMSRDEQKSFILQKHYEQSEVNKGLLSIKEINEDKKKNEYRRVIASNNRSAEGSLESIGRDIARATSVEGVNTRLTEGERRRLIQGYKNYIGQNWRSQRRDITNFREGRGHNNSLAGYYVSESISGQDLRGATQMLGEKLISTREIVSKFNNELDANVLLELLEKTHGINPEIYRITVNAQGNDRIGAGSRNFGMYDFCRKEMHFTWQESMDILEMALNMQLAVFREKGYDKNQRRYLSEDYQGWLNTKRLDQDNSTVLVWKNEQKKFIHDNYKKNIRLVNQNETFTLSQKEQQKVGLRMARDLAFDRLSDQVKAQQRELRRKNKRDLQDSYREFLVERARSNEQQALDELRRLRIDFAEYQESMIFTYVERYQEYRLPLSHEIDKNGVIHYKTGETTILKDHGKWVETIKSKDEYLALAIQLATNKFGNRLNLRGKEDFKRKVVDYVLKEGIQIEFLDEFSKKFYHDKLAQAKITEGLLTKDRALLREDKPQMLLVNELISKDILQNGRLLTRNLVQVSDENTNKRYWVGDYQTHFKAKDLELGKPVDVVYSAATDEFNIKIKPEYRLKQQLRKQALEEIRQQFNAQITNEQQKPRETYYGKFLKSGSNRSGDWVLIKLDDGKLVKINSTDVFENLKNSVRGEQVCVSLLGEVDVIKPTTQKMLEVVDSKNELSEMLNRYCSNSQQFIGKLIKQTEFKYSDGKAGYRMVVRNVENGKNHVIFSRQKQQLETYALFGLINSGWQIIKRVDVNNLPQNTRSSVTGEVCGYGQTVIRGKNVFYCSFKTSDGEVRKYGQDVQKLVESGKLAVGKYCTLLTLEREASVVEKRSIFSSQNVTKNVEQLTEKLLEQHKHTAQKTL